MLRSRKVWRANPCSSGPSEWSFLNEIHIKFVRIHTGCVLLLTSKWLCTISLPWAKEVRSHPPRQPPYPGPGVSAADRAPEHNFQLGWEEKENPLRLAARNLFSAWSSATPTGFHCRRCQRGLTDERGEWTWSDKRWVKKRLVLCYLQIETTLDMPLHTFIKRRTKENESKMCDLDELQDLMQVPLPQVDTLPSK